MFGIVNNLIGFAVLILFVWSVDWSLWLAVPVGLVLMTAVTVVLGMIKARVSKPSGA